MDKHIATANIKNAFGWRFTNVPKTENGFEREDDRIIQLETDVNIGFEKDQRSLLLRHIEGLTREKLTLQLRIPLIPTPEDSPHYLDNIEEVIKFNKHSFSELLISRVNKGKYIVIRDSTIELSLDLNGMHELFVRLYTNMEIYATYEDNIMNVNGEKNENMRLVVWGVSNGKPIQY